MEFYISPQSGQFYMINVLENQWLSVTYEKGLSCKRRLAGENERTLVLPVDIASVHNNNMTVNMLSCSGGPKLLALIIQ